LPHAVRGAYAPGVIVEGLRPLAVPIGSVRPLERNPRRGDVEALKRLLTRFGQRRPITVRAATGEITAGNHVWHAARELGWTEIAALILDDDEQTAVAWSLGDNWSHDAGWYDQAELDELLADVADYDPDILEAIGFHPADALVDLMAGTDADYVPFSAAADPVAASTVPDATPPPVEAPRPAPPAPPVEGEAQPEVEVEDRPMDDVYAQYADRAAAPPLQAGEKLARDEWVIFQFRDFRGRVTRAVYDEFYAAVVAEAGGLPQAGPLLLTRMGIPEADAAPLAAGVTYDDRGR
jgi:hypothetical protein